MERLATAADEFSAWKWALPVLCVLAFLLLVGSVLDLVGVGARPWFGFWDSLPAGSGRPYIYRVGATTPGGATWRAGLRDGDLLDLRRQDLQARVAIPQQPLASQTTTLHVQRGDQRFTTRLLGSTMFEGNAAYKAAGFLPFLTAYFLMLSCAWLIALRRWQRTEARYLCLALVSIAGSVVDPINVVVPNALVYAWLWPISSVFNCASALIPVMLGMRFGVRSRWRAIIDLVAFLSAAVIFGASLLGTIGIVNLSIDPLPFSRTGTPFLDYTYLALFGFASLSVAAAVATVARSQRAGSAWLLLPIPTGIFIASIFSGLADVATSWYLSEALRAINAAIFLAAAASVTYALLRRRVLDLNFIIGRSLVVAGVSVIVVASFVLLEWLLDRVLDVSHVAGVAANACLALVLGLSIQAIHKRVDRFVDFAFFHKRYENERALLDFANEAAFVTQRDALLDQAIEKIAGHTDAGGAALLLEEGGSYVPVRSFGLNFDAVIDENDPVILALKTHHAPIDPHRYAGSVKGDLVIPMLGRGRLLGMLLLTERKTGEGYAPDEVEALSRFAHGIGVVLDALPSHDGDSLAELRSGMLAIQTALLELPEAIAREVRKSTTSF